MLQKQHTEFPITFMQILDLSACGDGLRTSGAMTVPVTPALAFYSVCSE